MPDVAALSEDVVPTRARRWIERTSEYVASKREQEEVGESWTKTLGWVLGRFPSHIWPNVGVDPAPLNAREVTRVMVRALRDSPVYAPKTRAQYLQALRGFVRWEGCELSEDPHLWHLEALPRKKRWLTRDQLHALWEASREDLDQLVVAAEGFNGLRRIELMRLRVRDVDLAPSDPTMLVTGKGRNGGKLRRVPVTRQLFGVLLRVCAAKPADARIYPQSRSSIDKRLDRLRLSAGIGPRVSSHDLRRTFGRLAYQAGVSLVNLKAIYGHESIEDTSQYVGIDHDELRAELQKFELALARPAPTPESS